MKTFLKFTSAIAAVLALVAFILMLATPAIHYEGNFGPIGFTGDTSGTVGIFGDKNVAGTWSAIIAFIFIIVAFVALVCHAVLPLALKKGAILNILPLCALCAAAMLIVAGIFIFIEVPCFWGAQGSDTYGTLGVGWVFAGILSCAAGVVGLLPVCAKLLKK